MSFLNLYKKLQRLILVACIWKPHEIFWPLYSGAHELVANYLSNQHVALFTTSHASASCFKIFLYLDPHQLNSLRSREDVRLNYWAESKACMTKLDISIMAIWDIKGFYVIDDSINCEVRWKSNNSLKTKSLNRTQALSSLIFQTCDMTQSSRSYNFFSKE